MPPTYGGWCRRSPPAPMWSGSTLVLRALETAGVRLEEVDAVAATAGPASSAGCWSG